MSVQSVATRNRAFVLFSLVSLLLGFGFVAIKIGLGFIPPLLFAAFRLDIAAVLLLAYAILRTDDWRPRTRQDAAGIIAGGIFFVFGSLSLLFIGLEQSTSGVAAIIFSFDPVLTIALAALLLTDERLSRFGLFGVVIALVGVAIVVQPSPARFVSGNLRGEEYILLGAMSLALGGVLIRLSHHQMGKITLTAWAMAVAAPAMHLVSLGIGESLASISPTVTALAALLYVGVLMTAIAYPMYVTLIEDIGAVRASFVQYIVPVVASVAGWLVLGERLTPEAFVGFLVIFLGFLLMSSGEVTVVIDRFRPSSTSREEAEDATADVR
ncbi:DMT family transporter [Haladaptatus caseinilyticus]|uniref:DMT family transporter n=1 Tax=Haladaptatus caseinilyticus TaxID=2993314 RepID=UPI00224AED5D|nr:EamA family transporter [Haladaptatus caseinilyticus]